MEYNVNEKRKSIESSGYSIFAKITCFACLFVFFITFFYSVHPIQIFDVDDWQNVYYTRSAYPKWGNWNPIKVLPEVLMPLLSEIAAYVVYPINNCFFESISITYAVFISMLLLVENIAVFRFAYKKCNNYKIALLSMLFFVAFHFWSFRVFHSNNMYMYRAINATAYFHYLVPNIFNCILVLLLLDKYKERREMSLVQKAFWVIGIYFAVFSNLFSSIILISFLFVESAIIFIDGIKHKERLRNTICRSSLNIYGLLLWFISLVFEFNGGRAGSGYSWRNYPGDLQKTISGLLIVVRDLMNRKFLLFSVAIILIMFLVLLINKQMGQLLNILPVLVSVAIVIAFELMVIARVNPEYIFREDVLYGIFFYSTILVVVGICISMKKILILRVVYPLLLVIILLNCNTSGCTYLESNLANFSSASVNRIDYDILNQIEIAHKNGETKVQVTVPKHPVIESSLAQEFAFDRPCKLFNKCGVIDYLLDVEIKMDEQKNYMINIIPEYR